MEATESQIGEQFERLPLSFIENRGQTDPRAGYYLHGGETSVYFTEGGLRLGLEDAGGTAQRWNLALDFVGARPTAPRGVAKAPGVVSYFKGDREDWHTALPTYSRVAYRDLWPGIDLTYSGIGTLKYSFLVRPGADPTDIRFRWRGATDLSLDHQGGLHVSTPARSFTDQAPVSYQRIGGYRVEVATSYVLRRTEVAFELQAYTPSRPLVIDPAMLLYAGYIGGSSFDTGHAVAVDGAGAAYVTGRTASTEATFPETVGPDLSYNGGRDTFVAKVAPSGASLTYAGYIGGSNDDEGFGVAVDGSGAAYVTGYTASTEATFPETVGPDLSHNGMADAFVAKVAPSGASLAYAGYIGGSATDEGLGVAVDGSGSAYVAGRTDSTEVSFPETGGPDLTYNGMEDAFVAKVAPSGASLSYAGYIGGSGSDRGLGVAVDGAGAAYVSGRTESTEATFPETVGPDLTHNGGRDAFVAKVAPSGASLTYAGYIGGSATDEGFGVAVDGAGNAYVAGRADSTEATFPETVGPDLTHNGMADAFVAKVVPSGASLAYAGYIGGSGLDEAVGIAVHGTGGAYVTGSTASTEATFPEAVGPDLTHNGFNDAFVAKVDPSGASLSYAGYIGGSDGDDGRGVAVDGAGNAYVTGSTSSTEATFPEAVGPDLTYNGME
ncbi:MAG: SBBP repeat-containing protein, partial [Actinomycetota bacterium]